MSHEFPMFPPPTLTPITAPYWHGARHGQLLIQRCESCGYHRHPPTTACYHCRSLDSYWDEVSGNGTVYSYVWADQPVTPLFAEYGVYNVSVIELDDTEGEPVRVVSRVNGVDKDTLRIGLPVEVDFDPVDSEIALPVFVPRAPGG